MKKIEILSELYELTLRQKKAIDLGLIPRFMRLLEEKEKLISLIDTAEEFADSLEREKGDTLLKSINELNELNINAMKQQKRELKTELDRIVKSKTILDGTYESKEDVSGYYVDNKK